MNNSLLIQFENHMIKTLKDFKGINHELLSSMMYSIEAGGKRIRPLLLLNTALALRGENNESDFVFACAIEMIHTYSLIHDDLPSMDDDDLRRNIPTNHIKYGEAIAILAGDGLLNTAMELLISQISNESTKNAAMVIARASGANGMISGQAYDVKTVESKEQLLMMHQLKTAELLKSAIMAGAYLAKADEQLINKLEVFGEKLGIAFQISDDLLDVEGEESLIGKPLNSDKKNNKSTYVSFYGLNQSKQLLNDTVKQALDSIEDLGLVYLETLAKFMLERKY
ncbi:MAG: polyprenyl synthetase family protein [Clostridiales bacterium]|nr:polyprenyl synthetase family protein [Clostridiales bacterium]